MIVTDLCPAPQHAAKSKVRQFDLKKSVIIIVKGK